jgi:excisionase family DNA binding protein
MGDERYYTTAEVASMLKVVEERVRRWCRSGRIHGVKLGSIGSQQEKWRIPHTELQRILQQPKRRSRATS